MPGSGINLVTWRVLEIGVVGLLERLPAKSWKVCRSSTTAPNFPNLCGSR